MGGRWQAGRSCWPLPAIAITGRKAFSASRRASFPTAQGWGQFSQKRAARSQENMLHLAYGAARLNQLHLALPDGAKGASVTATASIGRRRVPVNVTVPPDSLTAQLAFAAPLTLKAGQMLRITLGWG